MGIEFQKMNGLGNDFIMIDDRQGRLELGSREVEALCDRHFGIGADGVILVRPSENPQCAAYMHYINSDGTLAQMCGNGVRCFAKYLVDNGIVDEAAGELVADTLAGPRPITFSVDGEGKLAEATVDMGAPILEPTAVPVAAAADAASPTGQPFVRDLSLDSPWGPFTFTCVSMGNPHAVTFIDNFAALPDDLFADASNKCLGTLDLNKVGRFFETHEAFPEKTNVEFATMLEPNGEDEEGGILMRVYERGCAETLACGTGACATSVAATLRGLSGRANAVHLLGGNLRIRWDDSGTVLMTGPAHTAFRGTFER